jgi:hypothetical protein
VKAVTTFAKRAPEEGLTVERRVFAAKRAIDHAAHMKRYRRSLSNPVSDRRNASSYPIQMRVWGLSLVGLGEELSVAARRAAVGRAKQGSISIEPVMGGGKQIEAG